MKTVEPPEKHRRKRCSHPRKLFESDFPEKESQFVTMSQENGKSTERWSSHPDNWYEKSSIIENIPDKSEDLTVVCDFSEENVSTSSDAEQDGLTQQLLICSVTSENFPEEIVPYPRKICKRRVSNTDSKIELLQRFSDRPKRLSLQPLQWCQRGRPG